MPELGSLGWNLKKYCHARNQLHRINLIAKFRARIQMHKFGDKNAIFG